MAGQEDVAGGPEVDGEARHLARDFAPTNLLRTEGTRNLYLAARDVGATKIVAQGLAYAFAVKSVSDALLAA